MVKKIFFLSLLSSFILKTALAEKKSWSENSKNRCEKLIDTAFLKAQKTDFKDKNQLVLEIEKIFDYRIFAELALEDHLNKLSEEQKKEFFTKFNLVLKKNLKKKLKTVKRKVSSFKIESIKEIKKDRYKLTYIFKDDTSESFKIVLSCSEAKNKIYNFSIKNIDLLTNYKAMFNRILRRDGFSTLISKLEKKISEK